MKTSCRDLWDVISQTTCTPHTMNSGVRRNLPEDEINPPAGLDTLAAPQGENRPDVLWTLEFD